MNWTWKDELERMAQQVQYEADVQNTTVDVFDPPRCLSVREMRQDNYIAHLERRLRRAERWADALLWVFLASLLVNIFQLWN